MACLYVEGVSEKDPLVACGKNNEPYVNFLLKVNNGMIAPVPQEVFIDVMVARIPLPYGLDRTGFYAYIQYNKLSRRKRALVMTYTHGNYEHHVDLINRIFAYIKSTTLYTTDGTFDELARINMQLALLNDRKNTLLTPR